MEPSPFIQPGREGEWRTKRPPRAWQLHDRLLFWASSPRLELIALGEFLRETNRKTADGEVIYKLKYLTPVVPNPLSHAELKVDSALESASFLRPGVAQSVVRLLDEHAAHLYRLMATKNS